MSHNRTSTNEHSTFSTHLATATLLKTKNFQLSNKQLQMWLDLQPADIKSRWRHNWKSAQVVNFHLVSVCDPTIRPPGLDLPRQQLSLLHRSFARNRDTAMPAEGNDNLQTLICVLVVSPRPCPTLSNPVP